MTTFQTQCYEALKQASCHRVVKSNGELGGFADDISVKIKPLHEEGVLVRVNKVVDFDKVRSP